MDTATALFSHRKHWAHTFGAAPFLPMSRAEMDTLGWDACDIVLVTGDAYVDHPSFAMAILGRVLEAAGFRVAILSQPDWQSCEPWRQFGRPRLLFAISAGNMDSLINHYTANRKLRNDDAYSPGGRIGLRPDRATLPPNPPPWRTHPFLKTFDLQVVALIQRHTSGLIRAEVLAPFLLGSFVGHP